MMREGFDAVALDRSDNVATALRSLQAGERVRIGHPDGTIELMTAEPIPLCHKLALADLGAGAPILKYGEPIGDATLPVAAGSHVHVHNLRSRKARR
jgi:hypothetical protein